MQRGNKTLIAFLFGMAEVSCAGASTPPDNLKELSDTSERVVTIIRSGDLNQLKPIILEPNITFDDSNNIDAGIACFLRWHNGCENRKVPIGEILDSGFFKYYYHIDKDSITVSFIKNSKRQDFYANPELFLSTRYLSDYFSCHFKELNGKWFLTESVCFSETEGPFDDEPEV